MKELPLALWYVVVLLHVFHNPVSIVPALILSYPVGVLTADVVAGVYSVLLGNPLHLLKRVLVRLLGDKPVTSLVPKKIDRDNKRIKYPGFLLWLWLEKNRRRTRI